MSDVAITDGDQLRDVRAVVKETLEATGANVELTDDLSLIDSGLLDSMGIVILIQGLQAKFDIEFDFADITLENFGSVDRVSEFLTSRLG